MNSLPPSWTPSTMKLAAGKPPCAVEIPRIVINVSLDRNVSRMITLGVRSTTWRNDSTREFSRSSEVKAVIDSGIS